MTGSTRLGRKGAGISQLVGIFCLLRIVVFTRPVADHFFVASATLPSDLAEKLRTLLMDLNKSPSGKVILTAIHPDMVKFVAPKDSDHDSLRTIVSERNPGTQR